MKTTLYLLRHGATEANPAEPARVHGRRHNTALARLGIRQAEATRDFLAIRPIDHCYCSPMLRAVQTAAIVAAPHGLSPEPLEALNECDVGRWEGLDWPAIRYLDAEAYQHFMACPGEHGYPGGESFTTIYQRVSACLNALFDRHAGQSVLVVTHHAVNRIYLAGLMGLAPPQAQQLWLDNCGISLVVREGEETTVTTLNAAFHLQGVAA